MLNFARDSGLETKKNAIVKKSKKAQKSKHQKISSNEVAEKDSEETVLFQDSEETFTDLARTSNASEPAVYAK